MKFFYLTVLMLIFSNIAFGFDYKKYDKAVYGLTSIKGDDEIKRRIAELDSYIVDINKDLSINPEDAQLNYIKGRIIYAYIYTIPRPRTNQQTIRVTTLKKETYTWYKKSMDYDRGELTADQLYIMNRFSADLSVKAIDKILKRDKRLIGEDARITDLRRSKIVALIKIGEYDLAQNEVKYLREKYPNRFKESSANYYEEEIVKAKNKIEKIDLKNNSEVKDVAVSKQDEAKDINKELLEEKPSLIDKAIENAESETIELDFTAHRHWLFLFALIVVFGLYFNSRRKG